jgi:glyoxylase-like metal-dependent hydrolase (beta-lactamase superfamily II)
MTTRRTFLNAVLATSAYYMPQLYAGAIKRTIAGARSITAFKYAQSTLSESSIFRNGSRDRRLPISFLFYLIEDGANKILVDVGCDFMPGFKMEHFIRPSELLKRYGILTGDISTAVITHAHHDHIGAVASFKNTTIVIQQDEAAKGEKYLKGLRVETFKDKFEIAPGIDVLKIGGHSVGSSIVQLKSERKTHILAGDECYVRACLERKIPTGASFNPKKSEEFIRKYSSPSYEVHLYHDFSTLPGRNGRAERVFI